MHRIAAYLAFAAQLSLLWMAGCQRPYRRSDDAPESDEDRTPSEEVETQPDPRLPRDPDATETRRGFWVEQPTETGGVSSTALANRLAERLPKLRKNCCVTSGDCVGRRGRILFEVRLAPDGRVESAGIGETSVYDDALQSCILRHLRTWRLAGHDGPKSADVVIPLHLNFPVRDAG